MKQLRGSARARVAATAQRSFELLSAIERYPQWYPEVVRKLNVVERNAAAEATTVSAVLHVALGPLGRDLPLLLGVAREPPAKVTLSRIPHDSSDPERFAVKWTVQAGAQTAIALELEAELDVPKLVPVGGAGDAAAAAFVDAAVGALSSNPGSASPL